MQQNEYKKSSPHEHKREHHPCQRQETRSIHESYQSRDAQPPLSLVAIHLNYSPQGILSSQIVTSHIDIPRK